MLMIGPPGAGKTLLARAMPGILPEMSVEEALDGRDEKFVQAMIAFGEGYGAIVREDHRLFIDAFRNHQFPGI